MKVINFGSLNIDFVYSMEHFVRQGETLSSFGIEKFAGGKGLNQSIAVARAGGDVIHAGVYGADGDFLKNMLKESGVDVTYLKEVKETNGHAIIQVDKSGDNAIVLYAGTNNMIDEEYIDYIFDNVSGKAIVLFQNETSKIDYAMRKAKQLGYRVAFNPAPMNDKVLEYPLDMVDILILNLTEGEGLANQTESDRILEVLCDMYPKAKFILTLGSHGAWFADAHNKFFVKAKKVNNVVDTTAAGDTFIGYYLANINKGCSDKEALEIATRAAALCIQKKGAAVSIPKIL